MEESTWAVAETTVRLIEGNGYSLRIPLDETLTFCQDIAEESEEIARMREIVNDVMEPDVVFYSGT